MEYKSYRVELKANFERKANENGITIAGSIEGHASAFGNMDHDGDIIDAGAFADTIKEDFPRNRIKLFWWHRDPIGRPTHLAEDSKGLEFEADVSDTRLGRDVLTMVEDGSIDLMSIGFRALKVMVDQSEETVEEFGDPVRHIQKTRLFELSPVPFASNEATSVRPAKGLALFTDALPAGHSALQLKGLLEYLTQLGEQAAKGLADLLKQPPAEIVNPEPNKSEVEAAVAALKQYRNDLTPLIQHLQGTQQ